MQNYSVLAKSCWRAIPSLLAIATTLAAAMSARADVIPNGTEFQVSTPTLEPYASCSHVAADAFGNFVVVWVERRWSTRSEGLSSAAACETLNPTRKTLHLGWSPPPLCVPFKPAIYAGVWRWICESQRVFYGLWTAVGWCSLLSSPIPDTRRSVVARRTDPSPKVVPPLTEHFLA